MFLIVFIFVIMSWLLNFGKSVLGGVVGAGIDAASQSISAAQQYKYQKRLQDAQQQYNTEMWNKQNEYNTPTAQIQRLQDAGVNPMLAIGGSGLQNVAASSSTPSAPGFSMPNSSAGNRVGDNFIEQQQMDARLDTLTKQGQYYLAMINSINAGTDRTLFDLGIDKELRPDIISGRKGKLSSDSMQGEFMKEQLETFRLKNGYTRDVMQDMKQQMAYTTAWMETRNKMQTIEYNNLDAKLKSEIQNTYAQAFASIQAGNLSKAKIKEVYAQCVYLDAAARLANSNASFQDELLKNGGADPIRLMREQKGFDIEKADAIIGKQFQADLNLAEVNYEHSIGLQDNQFWNDMKNPQRWISSFSDAGQAVAGLMTGTSSVTNAVSKLAPRAVVRGFHR